MDIYQYERPPGDTRIGVHWSPGRPLSVGLDAIRNQWLPLLVEMGVKWVKMLHPDGLPLAELLLANDIMPIVRLYRERPNANDLEKGTLGASELHALADYVAVGVRYFEFNNEPDVPTEWRGGPPNDADIAQEIVARHAMHDMETIIKAGGYPAIPATAVSTRWDLLGEIIRQGGKELLEGPVWWAIHNYDINHPLDYPYDDVNQNGKQIPKAAYDTLGPWAWDGETWHQRSLNMVNRHRSEGANPGDTIFDDNSSWLAYTYFDGLAMEHLGRHIPILSTESGPIVGEDSDPRYPTTLPESHRDKVIAMAHIMMGDDSAYPQAPDYYFCTAFWILANHELGSTSDQWEKQAWLSSAWDGGKLPVVDALRALPKKAWVLIGAGGSNQQQSVISGQALSGDGLTVRLRSNDYLEDREIANERYLFAGLGAGVYTLTVLGSQIEQRDLVLDGSNHLTVDLDLHAFTHQSVVYGSVKHAEGHVLRLSGPASRKRTLAADGHFRFIRLPAGTYNLEIRDTDLQYHGIVLDGHNQAEVNLDLQPHLAWNYSVRDGGPGPGFAVVRCSVDDKPNLSVHLWADGWNGVEQRTGSKPEYGPFACEFAPLGGGHYYLEPAEIGLRVTLDLPADRVTWVEFVQQMVTGPTHNSVIEGTVENGNGYTLRLTGPISDDIELGPDGRFRFANLSAGLYNLTIIGSDIQRSGLRVNGYNTLMVHLTLPKPQRSIVRGTVTGSSGSQLSLASEQKTWTTKCDQEGHYAFVGLPEGLYTLQVIGTALRKEDIHLDGSNEAVVNFMLPLLSPAETWIYQVYDGGPGPGFGVVRCQVKGKTGLSVHIWADGWPGITQVTGSKAEYGHDVCEFAPLGSGHYFVQPEGLQITASVMITGQRIMWVVFQKASHSSFMPFVPQDA